MKTELTIVPTADYASKLQPVLDSGQGAPDVFTAEIAWVKQWVDMPYWENLSDAPYNVNDWEKDYVPYVWNIGKDNNGKVKALSWQATQVDLFIRDGLQERYGEMMTQHS
ncbi:extracellular solute-binding protein [Caloramator sp. mosi_1]|uniref:extracellular solute-binding protein n=1 Tax=Caloramator sp. mosi_1 TaxID=3023090 RepID=UPI00235F3708|nr:extracellular solute-binding protein [Caloramator sp. mosi_1]WDC85653.1 extracellular solute-binding protein [Caloramator sp. mosi_1]